MLTGFSGVALNLEFSPWFPATKSISPSESKSPDARQFHQLCFNWQISFFS
jgi:hypothetical protein